LDEISQCPRKRLLLVAYNVSLMPLVYGISSNRVLDFLFSELVLVCVCFICEFSNSTYVSRLFYYMIGFWICTQISFLYAYDISTVSVGIKE
jgi:hypothetical protein